MMDALRSWMLSVTAAAILCALADCVMPQGGVRRAGRIVAGLVMAAAVLAPLSGGRLTADLDWDGDWMALISWSDPQLEQEGERMEQEVISQACETYIAEKAAGLGADCQVEVACRQQDEVPLPWAVTVWGEMTQSQREQLSQIIQEDLDVPQERQSFATKEEGP